MKSKLSLPIKAKPYRYQEEAAKFALEVLGYASNPARSKSTAILAEMGTGKSLITIATAEQFYKGGHIKRMLVVAPPSITGV